MQVISAVFSPQERQRRMKELGNPVLEVTQCLPPIYVLVRGGRKLGVGLTVDAAIADAESNLESWIERGKKKWSHTIVCKKQKSA